MRDGDAAALVAGRDDEFHRWIRAPSPEPAPIAVIELGGEVAGWVDRDHDADRTWLDAHECNVGYHVFATARGQGVASGAVRLLLSLLADEGRYRTATFLIDAENEASLRVACAIGARERRRFDLDGRPMVLLACEVPSLR
jgi:RimJ/RimL family protein N-acetyltransferase